MTEPFLLALVLALSVAVVLLATWCVASERAHGRRDRMLELWRDEVARLNKEARRRE